MAIDPICGMEVDERSPLRAQRDGQTYFFCCESCRRRFLGIESPPAHGAAPTAYICPMCPGVRSPVPAACPECGMALEPEQPCHGSLDDTTELYDMTRRLLIATPPTLIVMILAMGPMVGIGLPEFLAGKANGVWQAILTGVVLVYAGWPILSRAVASVATGRLNMFTLIGVGTVAAYLFSLATLLLTSTGPHADSPASHPDSQHNQKHDQPRGFPPSAVASGMTRGHGPPLYFESAAAIVTLVLLGQMLELRARRRTGDAVRALLDLTPPIAHRWSESGETDTPLAEVRPGDQLSVRPGEKVPVDGVLLAGTAAVSEALLTGEPMPIAKSPGDRLLAGSLNQSHAFLMRAEHTGADTLLAKVIQLVVQAQRSRAPIQRVADQVAAYFVPAVLAVAALTFAVWWWLGGEDAYVRGLVHAVSVLVIACPCALGLATPMSVIVGVGRGAREGVLIRDAETLEQLARIDTVVFDKTGTLTVGRPELRAVLPLAPFQRAEVIRLAAAVERWSEHPLGRAIVAAHAAEKSVAEANVMSNVRQTETVDATSRGAEPLSGGRVAPDDFVSAAGGGVAGRVEGRMVRVGSRAFCEAPRLDAFLPLPAKRPSAAQHAPASDGSVQKPVVQLVSLSFGVATPAFQPWPDGPWQAWTESWRERGCTVMFVAVDGRPAGLIALHDPIKPDAAGTLAALRLRGLRLAMATGDNERTALEVARRVAQPELTDGPWEEDVAAGPVGGSSRAMGSLPTAGSPPESSYGLAGDAGEPGELFDQVRAGLSPGEKLAVLETLRRSGRRVAMLGDGVNDAPALAAADVGVAMGTGSDVAIESADVTLVAGDLAAFVRAVDLSRAVMRNIRQNLFFAFVYNGLGIPLAAGVLQPILGLTFGPMAAAVAMSFSSVSVIANSLRLAKRR
ncbi:MAG: heavy metal translocating P-type ATPase [Planctomycetota bacterium]